MKTSVIEVHDMLSVLSVQGVEERIGEVPGVESVTVNFSAGNATVRYDETRLDISDVKSDVRQRGYDKGAAASVSAGPRHTTLAEGADTSAATGTNGPGKAVEPVPAPPIPDAAAWHGVPGSGEKMSMPDKG